MPQIREAVRVSSCKYVAAAGSSLTAWEELTSREAALLAGIGKSTINRHRAGQCTCNDAGTPAKVAPAPQKAATLTGKADVTSDGGEFIDVQTEEPVTDWTRVFERFNLDPAAFDIVDDTVRCSTWQQSKALDDGTRDVVQLYSYRARFRRRASMDAPRLDDLIRDVRGWDPYPAPVMRPISPAVSLVVGLADFQLGKCESGNGTPQTLERINASLAATQRHIDSLRRDGVNIDHLVLANLGDHIENVNGSYDGQTYSVDLNMRDQLTLAIEVNMQWIKQLAPQFERTTYTACMCNHGQLSRGAGRNNVTDDSDNATGFIADTLRTVCNLHPDLAGIEWVIPRDEMITTFTANGVNIATAHGHKISGKEEAWLAAQSQYLTHTRRFIPELWFTAHKHHASLVDLGPYTRIQATTVDPGSKWLTDSNGQYSRPGVTSFLTAGHLPGKWSHYAVL